MCVSRCSRRHYYSSARSRLRDICKVEKLIVVYFPALKQLKKRNIDEDSQGIPKDSFLNKFQELQGCENRQLPKNYTNDYDKENLLARSENCSKWQQQQ